MNPATIIIPTPKEVEAICPRPTRYAPPLSIPRHGVMNQFEITEWCDWWNDGPNVARAKAKYVQDFYARYNCTGPEHQRAAFVHIGDIGPMKCLRRLD
jgi:hypothetical protein